MQKLIFCNVHNYLQNYNCNLFLFKHSFLKRLFFWWSSQKDKFQKFKFNFFFKSYKFKIIKQGKKLNFLKYYSKKFNLFFFKLFSNSVCYWKFRYFNSRFFNLINFYKLFYKLKLVFKQKLYLKLLSTKKTTPQKIQILYINQKIIFFYFKKTKKNIKHLKKKIKIVKIFLLIDFFKKFLKNFYIYNFSIFKKIICTWRLHNKLSLKRNFFKFKFYQDSGGAACVNFKKLNLKKLSKFNTNFFFFNFFKFSFINNYFDLNQIKDFNLFYKCAYTSGLFVINKFFSYYLVYCLTYFFLKKKMKFFKFLNNFIFLKKNKITFLCNYNSKNNFFDVHLIIN